VIHRRLFIGTAFAAFSPAARTKAEALSFPLPGDTWRRDFDGAVAVVISIGNGNVEWEALGELVVRLNAIWESMSLPKVSGFDAGLVKLFEAGEGFVSDG